MKGVSWQGDHKLVLWNYEQGFRHPFLLYLHSDPYPGREMPAWLFVMSMIFHQLSLSRETWQIKGFSRGVMKCMSKLSRETWQMKGFSRAVMKCMSEKRFQNQMICVINDKSIRIQYVCVCLSPMYQMCLISKKISESSSQRIKHNSRATWCPGHPSKEAKTYGFAYWVCGI